MGDAAPPPDPATPPPAQAPSPARRGAADAFVRLLRATLGGAFATLALLIATLGGLGGTEAGLRLLAEGATALSGGNLLIEGAEGHLLGHVRLAALRLHRADLHLDLTRVDLDWTPAALLHGRLDIAALSAADVVVATPPDDTPATLPASLELPVAVHVGRLHLDRLRIGALRDGAAAAPDVDLTEVEAAADSDGRLHRVATARARTAFGALAAQGQLDGRRPFALRAHADLATRQGGEAYTMQADAYGDLQTLTIDARAAGAGLSGEAHVAATPFAAMPFRSARLAIRDLDPARFHAAAPGARLDVSADLEPVASATDGTWSVAGPVRLLNRAPGRYDAGRLPVASLAALLRWGEGRLSLTDLDLRLPRGEVRGGASWVRAAAGAPDGDIGRVEADLQVRGVALPALDGRLPAATLAGRVQARADAGGQTVEADLRDPRVALRLAARHADGAVTVQELLARAGKARLSVRGAADLAGDGRFELKGRLDHFDPHAFFTEAPAADLTLDLEARGRRSPQMAATLSFQLAPSTLEGRPLVGHGTLAVDGRRLSDADLTLAVAANRLSARGRYGAPGDALDLHLEAPDLAALGHTLSGRVTAAAVLRGTPARPAGELELSAEGLAYGTVHVEGVNARGRLEEGADAPLNLLLNLAGVRTGADLEHGLRRASLVVDGRRSAHRAHLEAHTPGADALELELSGGLGDALRWQGRLDRLRVLGPHATTLAAPVPLVLAPAEVCIGAAELRSEAGAALRLDETRWADGEIVARGRLSGLPVGIGLDAAGANRAALGDTLRMGGDWDIHVGSHVDGTVHLFRERGDLLVLGDAPVRLGLDEVQIVVNAVASRLAFGFSVSGAQLGKASGAGTALAERLADGGVRLVPDAPLLGSAQLDMPSIAWTGPLADPNLKTAGRLKADFTLSGTPAQPVTEGRIRGEALAFAMADQGLNLSGGTLVADFNRDRLRVERFDFASPNRVKPNEGRIDVARLTRTPGSLQVKGEVALASGAGAFSFQAERLPLLQRPDQWLVLSGAGEVHSGWNSARIRGRLTADAGYVELSRTPAPSLGDDVEVVRPEQARPPAVKPFSTAVDLAIGLGDALYVRALGLDTRLAGELRLRAGDGQPLAMTGVINTQGGVYEGYGQKLDIERGIVTFTGAVSNPSLNVVALRKGLSVEAGVAITGTARRPLVRLVSEPNVPDPEKLAWIVLGRPPDQGSGGELALLLPAAQALLGTDSMSSGLVRALGFDEFSFGSSVDSRQRIQTSSVATGSVTGTTSSAGTTTGSESTAGQVVSIGKRLSARALLSFEQSVTGASSIVKLSYQLTRRIAVVGRAGSENALDAVFTLSFR